MSIFLLAECPQASNAIVAKTFSFRNVLPDVQRTLKGKVPTFRWPSVRDLSTARRHAG